MKMLDIFDGTPIEDEEAEKIFPDVEVTHLDIMEVDSAIIAGYDIIILNHCLMRLRPNQVPAFAERVAGGLNSKGELHLVTPSLEWAAGCIVYDNPNPAIMTTIYGITGGYHTGYTIIMLRDIVERIGGLVVRFAHQEPISVTMKDGNVVNAVQNKVIGWKP